MTFKKTYLPAVGGFVLGAAVASAAFASTGAALDKKAIEAIVKDYIAAHGEEIIASVQDASNRAHMAQMQQIVGKAAPARGPQDAPITIVEFSDYECPFCARVQPSLAAIAKAYDGKIRWVFKNLPLSFHDNARPAAYAALAANKQGKFWEYHAALWQHQDSLNDKTYEKLAQDLGLDLAKFNADRASQGVVDTVDADLKDAEAMGARGTPHFLVNGEALSGALPPEEFKRVIDSKLAESAAKQGN